MAACRSFCRSAVIFLLICLIISCLSKHRTEMSKKSDILNLETLVVTWNVSSVSICSMRFRGPKKVDQLKSTPKVLSRRLVAVIYLLKFSLAANLVLLSGDVAINPGPVELRSQGCFASSARVSSSCYPSMSPSLESSSPSSPSDNEYCNPYPTFDLGLPSYGLKMGHWNINRLSTTKMEQIKLFLLNKGGQPQVDLLFLNETFLKSSIPDVLFDVPGFTLFRKDRGDKCGGGVMAFVNSSLRVKRRIDLEEPGLEVIWLEIYPFKSNRSLFTAGVYRAPSFLKDDDIRLEKNIETAYLMNKETIILGDFNIDYHKRDDYKKHRLSKGFKSMQFEQVVDFTTRPVSELVLITFIQIIPKGFWMSSIVTLDWLTTYPFLRFGNTIE